MAARNYGMAYDTPYNQRIHDVLRKYNMERDINGEPNNIREPMHGGAFLASDGSLVDKSMRYHPHLASPITGAMSREMQGGRSREYVMEGGLRPPGMVSPFIRPASDGSHMVVPGTMATYPMYNAVEMRSLNGGFFFPAAMALGRIAAPAIASAVIGAVANKGMEKILGSGAAVCPSCEAAQAHMMPDGSMMLDSQMPKKRGRKKGGQGILDQKFSINEAKDFSKKLLGMGILDERFSINDVGRTGKELFGLGAKRGRKKGGQSILDQKFSVNEAKGAVKNLLGLGVKKRGRPKGSKGKKGAGILGDIKKGVGSLLGEVVSVAKPVIKDVAISVGKEALSSYLGSKGAKVPVKRGKGVMSGGMSGVGVMSGGATDGRKRRAEIVKKVMKEQGLKMVDASRYVKEHGLYK
jgi:hypothetical protein